MPRHYVAAFKKFDWYGSRLAENAAENASPTTIVGPVALVSVSRVLPKALVIALHKTLTENLG